MHNIMYIIFKPYFLNQITFNYVSMFTVKYMYILNFVKIGPLIDLSESVC